MTCPGARRHERRGAGEDMDPAWSPRHLGLRRPRRSGHRDEEHFGDNESYERPSDDGYHPANDNDARGPGK